VVARLKARLEEVKAGTRPQQAPPDEPITE